MCTNPQLIKNPNYLRMSDNPYMVLKDCTHQYMYIPCGHCPECIAVKQMNLIQRVQMESLNNHIFCSTLTYQDPELPRLEVNGYSIPYADFDDVTNMVRRINHYELFPRHLRYFCVSERGTERGRPHFHLLWFVPKEPGDNFLVLLNLEHQLYDVVLSQWKRNYGSNKKPDYHPLLIYHEKYVNGELKRNYDTHYVNPALTSDGVCNCSWYFLKYMLKPSTRDVRLQQALHLNLDPVEYERVWSIVKSRYTKSLDFGLKRDPGVQSYLHECVDRSKLHFDYPCFFNPDNGMSFPLARFYKDIPSIYSVDDAFYFYMKKPSVYVDSSDEYEVPTRQDEVQSYVKAFKRLKIVSSHEDDIIY